MKAITFLALLVLCLTAFTDSFAASEPEVGIEICVSLPLSGALSSIGTAVLNGIELARNEDANSFLGIEFLFEDNRYDAKATLASFDKMNGRPRMQLVYVWGSPTCMSVAAVAERDHRPLVCFSGDPKPGLDYVFSFNNPAQDYAAVMAKHLSSLTLPRTALIYSEIPFYGSLADALEAQLSNPKADFYRESVLPETQDFSVLINRLKLKQFSALALFLLPSQIPSFSKQMMTLDYHPSILGADTFSDAEAIRQSKGALSQAVYVDMAVDSTFANSYLKKYGNQNNLTFAYNGYRFALLLSDILRGQKHPLAAKALLNKMREYSVSGEQSQKAMRFESNKSFGQYFSFPIELKSVSSENDAN